MHGRGAKGSVKDRIYQFWLIQLFLKRKKKKQKKQELKQKRLEERRKKIYQEMFEVEENHWKLSKAPTVFQKKEGIKVTLFPFGKKPDKVIEVLEEKKKVGIEETKEEKEIKKELTEFVYKTEVIVKDTKEKAEKKVKEPKEAKEMKNALESNLSQIEILKKEYQTIIKRNPKAENTIVTVEPFKKQMASISMAKLSETEKICKEELKRVEEVLVAIPIITETEEQKKSEETLNLESEKKKSEEKSKIEEKNKNTKQKEQPSIEKKILRQGNQSIREKENIVNNQETLGSLEKVKENNVKENQNVSIIDKVVIDGPIQKGITTIAVAGGTLIAFPALLQSILNNKEKQKTKSEKKEKNENSDTNSNKSMQGDKDVNKEKSKNEKQEKEKKEKLDNERKEKKLKLYRNKLEASKEAEILIKSELQRQKDYLKKLDEKIGKLEISVRTQYRFRGIQHLITNVLKFAIGVFTIPFSRKRIFGTAIGLALIGNSIRGIRNSFRTEKNRISYIELKDFSKAIYSEQMALLKTKHLIVDSLDQLKDLKTELEEQYYGKISFDEYDEMLNKLNSIEQTLIIKQKEIITLEESLTKAEEKNKVKVKQIEEMQSRH